MPGRLYIKIFLCFIGVIVIAMFMVAMLFRFTEGETFVSRFQRFAKAQAVMVRTVVEEHAASHSGSVVEMKDLVDKLGEAYLADLWITDADGNVLVRSFDGPVPPPEQLASVDDDYDDPHNWKKMEGFDYVRCGDDPHRIYVTIPFGGTPEVPPGTIHYYYLDPSGDKHERFFWFGLVGICVSVALLVVPVSWFITRRLNRLRSVALRIAEGDLSHRADVCGRDEVAKVGRALNRMADSLSRMIRGGKELTANVSHELRTPLTRIRIAEEMLRQRCGDGCESHLDSIREDVDALDKLIGRLLELSKLDLKEDPFTMEDVDVAEMVGGIVSRLVPIADHRGLNVSATLPGEAVILADGEALYTALGNILENGIKHAERDGVVNVVLDSMANEVVLTVENSHAPLREEELETIFEPFRRARGAQPQGTGLGLAIARKIIEGHGGSVVAENTSAGVRFTVRLPAVQEK